MSLRKSFREKVRFDEKNEGDSEGCENNEDGKGYRHGTLRFIYFHLGGYGRLAAI